MENGSNDMKVEKKLLQTANRIKKKRDLNSNKNETAQYDEIKQLLQEVDDSEEESVPACNSKSDINELDIIPITAPGTQVLNIQHLYTLFDEDSLQLKSFFGSTKKPILGRDLSRLPEPSFRSLLLHHVFENVNLENSWQPLSLYVLYLESVHSDPQLVTACSRFLSLYPASVTPAQILHILVNYGACVGSGNNLMSESWMQQGASSKVKVFPTFNMQAVCSTLLQLASSHLVEIDKDASTLIKLLTKICLDPVVKLSTLFSGYSTLVSVLAAQASHSFGSEAVAGWLYLEGEHPCNTVEVCRVVLQPLTPQVHHYLVLYTAKTILEADNLLVSLPLETQHLKKILRELKRKDLSLLQIFCVLQLVTLALPFVTATVKDSKQIGSELTAVEAAVVHSNESTDVARIKSAVSKLRSLVAIKAGSLFNVGSNLALSPVKKV